MPTTRPPFTTVALATLAIGLGSAGLAQAQDTIAPTITFDAPTNGTVSVGSRITVSGTATDTGTTLAGTPGVVSRVQYRIEGSRRWRTATLVTPNQTTTTYVFRITMKKRKGRRVYVRAFDNSRNESDIIGRRLRRGRR